MNLTVILCTYNRCGTLVNALESVAGSRLPADVTWEVLVVDNNSHDRTREVVDSFANRHPGRFRYLFVPQPGKSHALNAGIQASTADVLAFMDDDVQVDSSWLNVLTAPLLGPSEWSGSGGPVILSWSSPQPKWLAQDIAFSLAPLAGFNPGDQPGQLHEPPFGTNMAFRRAMFDKYGYFRTDLGPSPRTDVPRPNEDTELGGRLIAGGELLRYEPTAIVYHPVPEDRLRKSYFLNWWFDKGRADVREFGNYPDAVCVRGVPLYVLRRLAGWTLRWLFATNPAYRFDCKVKVWGKFGEIRESRDQYTQRKRSKEAGASRCAIPL